MLRFDEIQSPRELRLMENLRVGARQGVKPKRESLTRSGSMRVFRFTRPALTDWLVSRGDSKTQRLQNQWFFPKTRVLRYRESVE